MGWGKGVNCAILYAGERNKSMDGNQVSVY